MSNSAYVEIALHLVWVTLVFRWSLSPYDEILAYIKIWLCQNCFASGPSGPSRLFWVTIVNFIWVILVVIHLFHTIWCLKYYNCIEKYPDVAYLKAYFANNGAFCPFEGPWGGPCRPQINIRLILPILGNIGLSKADEGPLGTPNQYLLLCMCSPGWYLYIPFHIGLNNLDYSGYNKK
jgi:hypothetical protein